MKTIGRTIEEQGTAPLSAWIIDAAFFPLRTVWPVLKEKIVTPLVILFVSLMLMGAYPLTVLVLAILRRRIARKTYTKFMADNAPSFEVGWNNPEVVGDSGGQIVRGFDTAQNYAGALVRAKRQGIYIKAYSPSPLPAPENNPELPA